MTTQWDLEAIQERKTRLERMVELISKAIVLLDTVKYHISVDFFEYGVIRQIADLQELLRQMAKESQETVISLRERAEEAEKCLHDL